MVKLSESAKFNKLNDLKEIVEEVVETTNTVVPFQGDGWDDAVNAINSIQIGPIDTAIKSSLWLSGFTAKLLSSIADGELHLQGVDYYGYQACMDSNIFYAPPRQVSGSSMKQCFQDCSTLLAAELVGREENTTGYGTSVVTTLENAFYNDRMLKMVDADKWDMSSVTNMKNMFNGCSLLEVCNVSDWDVSKVTTFESCFAYCYNLKDLDVSKWTLNTTGDVTLNGIFRNCRSLTSLDVSDWDVSKVTTLSYAFSNCSSLTTLDVSDWRPTALNGLIYAFVGCSGLTTIDLSSWSCTITGSMDQAFAGCANITTIDILNIDMTGVVSVYGIISSCGSLTSFKGLDMSGIGLLKGQNNSVSQYNQQATLTTTTLNNLTDCVLEGTLYRGVNITRLPNLDVQSLKSWFEALYNWTDNDEGKTSYEVEYDDNDEMIQQPKFVVTSAQLARIEAAKTSLYDSAIYYILLVTLKGFDIYSSANSATQTAIDGYYTTYASDIETLTEYILLELAGGNE